MGDREDRLLKELYNQGRPYGDVDPPEFDEVFQRAQAMAQPSPWQRPTIWMGAAAAVLAIVTVFVFSNIESSPTSEDAYLSSVPAESVESEWDQMEPVAGAAEVAVDDQEHWEELLEFADEVWEWESPTDFLL